MNRLNSILTALLIAVFFLFLGYLTIFPIEDSDIFFHLKAAEYIVQNQRLPSPDPFSYPIPNLDYPDWEYGAQLAYYAAFRLGGFNGVIIFKTLLITATFGLVLWLVYRLTGPGPVKGPTLGIIALIGLAAVANADRFMVRMEHVSNLFFAILLVLLYLYKYRNEERFTIQSASWPRTVRWRGWRTKLKIQNLLLLPPFFLLWINTHSTAVFALGIFGLFVASETLKLILTNLSTPSSRSGQVKRIGMNVPPLLAKWLGRLAANPLELPHLKLLWVVLGLSFLATLINPFFIKALLHPFQFAQSIYGQRIYEWMGPFSFFWRDTPYVFYFKVVAIVYGLAMLIGLFSLAEPKRRFGFDLTNYLLFAAFAYLGFTQVRHTAFFALFGLVPVTLTIAPLLGQGGKVGMVGKVGLVGILLFLIIGFYREGYVLGRTRRHFGMGLKPIYAEGALAFLDEQGISGNMFNQYGMGGYLIFAAPHRPVFMDGRNHYPEEFYREYLAAADSPEKLAEVAGKYDINYFITMHPEPGLGKTQVQFYLSQSNDWRLVYWDSYYLVYVRNNEENYPVIAKHYYFYADPVKLSDPDYFKQLSGWGEAATTARARTVRQLNRNLEVVPENTLAHLLLGRVYETVPSYSTAEEEYRQAVALGPEESMAHFLLGRALAQQGKLKEAKVELREAIRLEPRNGPAYAILGLIAKQEGDTGSAIRHLQKAFKLAPGIPRVNLELGLLYHRELGNREFAKEFFRRYLELEPEGEAADEVRMLLGR